MSPGDLVRLGVLNAPRTQGLYAERSNDKPDILRRCGELHDGDVGLVIATTSERGPMGTVWAKLVTNRGHVGWVPQSRILLVDLEEHEPG